jgi:hypothetical protein
MDHTDLETLSDAYLRGREQDFWARQEWRRIVESDLDTGWKTMLMMLGKAESDDGLGRDAAGAIEDLIDIHGHKAFDLIEEECEENSRLRLALSQVGVLFYYDEFDRWHALLCKYGYREVAANDSRVIAPKVMHLMICFLNTAIGVADYEYSMHELLDTPLNDKKAQRTIQAASYDIARLNDTTPPEHRTQQMLRDSELRTRVKQSLSELGSLGYRASSG